MKHLRALSLGAKLNLALLAFLLLLGAATSGLIIYGFNRTQNSATDRSNAALEEQGKLSLQTFVGGVSSIGSLQLEAAAETGRRAALYLDAKQSADGATTDTSALAVSAAGHIYDPDPDRVTDFLIISGVDPAAAEVQDDIAFSAPLETVFPIILQTFEGGVGGRDFDPIAIVFISTNGITRYYPPTGIHDVLPADADFTERMAQIGPANNPDRRTIWTAPYEDGGGQGQIITARTPVYDGDTFRGSLEVDISIARLTDQLNGVKPTPRGFAFYVDSAGALFRTNSFELLSTEAKSNPELAAILESMKLGETRWPVPVETLELQGEEFFIAYLPIDGAGGSVAAAAPVSDVTSQAALITAGIDDEGDRTIRVVLLAMGALFVVGLMGASYLNRQVILRPINTLVGATRAVAGGDFTTKVEVDREDELGTLAGSFNTMVQQLRESERVLEQRVDERTRELTGLLEVTRVVSSTLELKPLLDLVLEQTAVILPCHRSIVALREDDELVIQAVRAAGEADTDGTLARQVGMRFPLASTPVIWRELEGGTPLIVDDVHADEPLAKAYREEVGGTTGAAIAHFRSWMGIPLMVNGEFAGLLTVSLVEPNAYSPSHAALGKAIASQVAIAIDNARLFAREAQRSRELSTLLEVSLNAAASIDLKTLLNLVLRELGGVIPHDRVAIQTYEHGYLTVLAAYDGSPAGAKAQRSDGYRAKVADDFFATQFPDRMPAIIDDILDEGDLAREFRASAHPHITSGLVPHGSYMAIPLVSQDHIVGLLTVMRDQPGFYTVDHARLGRAIGSQIAIAVDRARSFEREARRSRELSTLLEVSRNVASRIELEPLLESVLDQVRAVADYDRGSVQVFEDGTFTVRAVRDFFNRPGYETQMRVGMKLPLPDTAIWSQFQENEPIILDDVNADSPLAAAYRSRLHGDVDQATMPSGSFMAIPLISQERIVGSISIGRDEVGFYTSEHARLARAIASQVAIAIENAQLYETARRRSREIETVVRADAELFSSLSLDVVLDALVDVVVDALGVDKVVVTLIDGPNMRVRASHGLAPESTARMEEIYSERRDAGLPALAQELTTFEDIELTDERVKPMLRAEGIRALLDAPIRSPDGVVGGFGIAYTSEHSFTDDERRLASVIAERAAVAIQNADLYERAQQSTREFEALLRADAELFRSLNLDTVLQALVDVAVDVLGADKSLVVLHEGDVDVVRAARNHAPDNLAAFNKVLSTMPHEEPPPEGQLPQVYIDAPAQAPEFVREALSRERIASHVSVPVKDTTRMLGVFGVSFVTTHTFTDEEQRLYVALADRAAVAIQNAELYEKAQHAASLEERQRLARELHDSVSQALYGIALGARTARLRIDESPSTAAEPIEYVATLAEAGLAEMRALIFELRPESLATEGLVAAIEKQIASIRARHQIAIDAELMEEPDCRLDVKEALYRITQEALQNVVKHALATRVTVKLAQNGSGLRLTVKDDGRGFDASQDFPGHIGLHSMPERAAKLGGTVVVESNPGSGTRVVAEVPI